MARKRKTLYQTPVEAAARSAIENLLIANSPAFTMGQDEQLALAAALAPPGGEYPMSHSPAPGEPNAYRTWLIRVLKTLVDCYPHPINTALDCIRRSLIEVDRGLEPNLFRPAKRARRKGNFAAQEAMNLAVLAANYIHDEVGDDQAYEQELADAGTSRREIEGWRDRVDPQYHNAAISAWRDLDGAKKLLKSSIEDYRAAQPQLMA